MNCSNPARTASVSCLFLVSLVTSGCGCGGAATQNEMTTARSSAVRVVDPQVSADDAKTLSTDNAAFAFAAYGNLKNASGNLVFSPISVSLALAMAYAGAAGDTASEMATALQFSLPPERLHPAFNALDLALATRGEGFLGTDGGPMRLQMINSVWGERTYSFKSEYLDTLALNYGAGVNLVDFVGSPEASRQVINAWVAQQTESKIADLLPPGAISAGTVLTLTNAVYFNAAWKYPFPPENTHDGPFARLDGSQVTVKMMLNAGAISALATPDLKAAALPYQDTRLSLLVVVPEPGKFDQVEASLDGKWLDGLVASMTVQSTLVKMPRFTVDTNAPVEDALVALGMQAAFQPGLADFSGIDGTRSLFIQNVEHRAYIVVGEKGTEAAASTAVSVGRGVPDITIVADRPFFYLLRDEPTGAILFMGRVVDPSQ